MKKFFGIYIWLVIIISIGNMIYVGLTGTGYESNLIDHINHNIQGIAIELGDCVFNYPNEPDKNKNIIKLQRCIFNKNKLVSSNFGINNKMFYIFTKAKNENNWTVHSKSKTDYPGILPLPGTKKIWLSELISIPNSEFYLVGATTNVKRKKLNHGTVLSSLPKNLKFSKLILVK